MTSASGQEFAYLLGELPEAEAAAFEEEVFADSARVEQLQAFESELFDAFAAGALSADRRARFEARFLHSKEQRERVAFSRALSARADRSATAWWRAWAWPRWGLAGLAAMTAALLLWVVLPGAGEEVRVSLHPQSVRAGSSPHVLRVGSGTQRITFELSLGDEPARAAWDVVVSGPDGVLWRGRPARADAVAVEVIMPAMKWREGLYSVELSSGGNPALEYEVQVESKK